MHSILGFRTLCLFDNQNTIIMSGITENYRNFDWGGIPNNETERLEQNAMELFDKLSLAQVLDLAEQFYMEGREKNAAKLASKYSKDFRTKLGYDTLENV